MIKYLKEDKELDIYLKENRVLLDFNATWCGPCEMLSPHLEKLSEKYNDVLIVKIDVDKFSEIASIYRINSIPALYYFENGKLKNSSIGYMPFENLERLIK